VLVVVAVVVVVGELGVVAELAAAPTEPTSRAVAFVVLLTRAMFRELPPGPTRRTPTRTTTRAESPRVHRRRGLVGTCVSSMCPAPRELVQLACQRTREIVAMRRPSFALGVGPEDA
jgi:hypothetical protein